MPKFQVRVTSVGTKKLQVLKTLRQVANLRLREAMNTFNHLHDRGPCLVVAGIGREAADHVVGMFLQAGAEAVAEASSLDAPMVLRLEADQLPKGKRRAAAS